MIMGKPIAIGVDLGGTKIEIAIVTASGQIEKKIRLATNVVGGPSAIEDQIVQAIRELQPNIENILGIGIGVAGQIEKDTGIVHLAPNLKWKNVPIQQNIEKKSGAKVVVVNDVRAATLGEWLFGAGKGSQDLVCLFVGTGIGGGVVSGGRLLTGASNSLGELGHMIIDWKGALCTCGSRGCLESIAGGWAIADRAREAVEKDRNKAAYILKLVDGKIDQITAKTVIEAYHAGDNFSKEIIEVTVEALIAGCVSIVNAFNPSQLILGGGIIDATPELIPQIEKGIRSKALPIAQSDLTVLPSQLGKEAGVIGAAALLFDK